MVLTNKSKVKEMMELQVASDFWLELEKKVEEMVKNAEDRAKKNLRRTVFGRDL